MINPESLSHSHQHQLQNKQVQIKTTMNGSNPSQSLSIPPFIADLNFERIERNDIELIATKSKHQNRSSHNNECVTTNNKSDKPFECNQCHRLFKRKSNLRIHQVLVFYAYQVLLRESL